MENKIQSPVFLKWAGGKRRILKDLEPLFPPRIERYFEPFLGAGSVFFFIKRKYNPKFCEISDINEDLIETYKAVRDFPHDLIKYLEYFRKNDSEPFYYKVRQSFNTSSISGIKRAAAFVYLNKTCFNGLYRVNSKNEFNVPYGKYEKPKVFERESILLANKLLRDVNIVCQDYRKISSKIKEGDFVYLDPCYDPIKKTSFVQYTPERFSSGDRLKLFKFITTLKERNAKILLSNNKIPEIQKLYLAAGFKFHNIETFRSLGGGMGRNKLKELAINNY